MLKPVEDGVAVVACSTCRHSADARDDAIVRKLAAQALGNFAQHPVARLVAVEIVNLLEVIYVHHEHRDLKAAKPGRGD